MAAPRGPPRAGGCEYPRPAGGTGDDWRLHLADDLGAGRMYQVGVTDRHGGEHLAQYRWQTGRRDGGGPGLWLSPQCGHGGAPAGRRRGAAPPRDLPPGNRGRPALECAALAAATRERQPEGHGWCCWAGQRYPVRLVAAKLDPTATRRARRRARRKAQKAGRTITAPTPPWRGGCCSSPPWTRAPGRRRTCCMCIAPGGKWNSCLKK